jgi:hypothetical protein
MTLHLNASLTWQVLIQDDYIGPIVLKKCQTCLSTGNTHYSASAAFKQPSQRGSNINAVLNNQDHRQPRKSPATGKAA